ncbi:hypothetical protein [Lautropia mirabilis]
MTRRRCHSHQVLYALFSSVPVLGAPSLRDAFRGQKSGVCRADIDCRCAVMLQYRGCAETVYLLPPEKREKTFGILLGAIATRILLTL